MKMAYSRGVVSQASGILSVDAWDHLSVCTFAVAEPIPPDTMCWAMTDETFISEAILPDAATFDAAAMASGRPGLPTGFTWQDRHYVIVETITQWKVSEREFHRKGEAYYRKHFWKVRVDSGEVMTIYAVRHVKRGESAKRRWWLYSIENAHP